MLYLREERLLHSELERAAVDSSTKVHLERRAAAEVRTECVSN